MTSKANRRADLRTVLGALGWLLLVCAAPARADWDVQQLLAELAKAGPAQARFVETKYLKVLKTPIESSGTLTFEPPDRMVKRTLQPKPETMTVEADKLVLERQGRTRTLRLSDYPVLWGFVESIRGTLKGDLDTLTRFYNLELTGNPQHWSLALKPRDAKMARVISGIGITGVNGRIRTVEVDEAQGDRSVMTVVDR